MQERITILSKENPNVILRAYPGHFIAPNAHSNYYLDMTAIKTRTHESYAAAKELAKQINPTTVVDTIVCMDGCSVIGAYLSEELTKSGIISVNSYRAINVVSPESASTGQLVFRDNIKPMINGKNVLLLVATAATGQTLARSAEALKYYGANIVSICTIFSVANTCFGLPVHSLFTSKDIPDYKIYAPDNCAMCKNKQPVDAFTNAFGYSKI